MIPESTKDVILSQFELDIDEAPAGDEDLIRVLADRIAYMMELEFEYLMSLMYRLDVSEKKVQAALSPENPEPSNISLAKLVIDRQVQRMETKKKYKQDQFDDWADF